MGTQEEQQNVKVTWDRLIIMGSLTTFLYTGPALVLARFSFFKEN